VDAGGHGGVGEAEGAGSQELSAVGWADEKLERTACEGVFFAGDLLRVCELTCRGDEGWGFQDLGGPVVGEGLHLEDRLAVAGAIGTRLSPASRVLSNRPFCRRHKFWSAFELLKFFNVFDSYGHCKGGVILLCNVHRSVEWLQISQKFYKEHWT
jgi:hypothetical protein